MMYYYILLILSLFLQYSYSFIFNSNDIIHNITNTKDTNLQNKLCNILYDRLITDEIICFIENKKKENFFNEYRLMSKIILMYINEFKFSKDELEYILFENDKDIENLKKNFNLFYIESFFSIKQIYEKLKDYYNNKFSLFLIKTYTFFKKIITIDELNEEVILPIDYKIKYFTYNTINKYNDCLELINSIDNSICLSIKKEIINLVFSN